MGITYQTRGDPVKTYLRPSEIEKPQSEKHVKTIWNYAWQPSVNCFTIMWRPFYNSVTNTWQPFTILWQPRATTEQSWNNHGTTKMKQFYNHETIMGQLCETAWQPFDNHVTNTGQLQYLTVIRQPSTMWQLFDNHVTTPGQQFDNHATSTWKLFDNHITIP